MSQIKIGTCVKGNEVLDMIPTVVANGFETISLYFTESIQGIDFVELSKRVEEKLAGTNVTVSSIGFYCNPLQYEEQRKELAYCIDHAPLFGAKVVGTFAGGLEGKCVYECLPVFQSVFAELVEHAKASGVKIGIENAPMYGHWYSVKCNIGYSPRAWEQMFDLVPSEYLGLEWEPSHQIEQLIDPIAQLKQWMPKIVHIHGKDAVLDYDHIKKYGIWFGEDYCKHRFPGLGDTDWKEIIDILAKGGYQQDIAIEGFHDPVFCGKREMEGQINALNYLKDCRNQVMEKQLSLRAFNKDDMDIFCEWLNRDYVKCWYDPIQEWIDEVKNASGEFDFVTHLIILAGEKRIGFCQYYPFDQSGEDWNGSIPLEGTYSIDYLIGEPDYLRKGFGRKAIQQLTKLVLSLPQVQRIIVQPNKKNAASRNTLISAGYRYISQLDVFLYEN